MHLYIVLCLTGLMSNLGHVMSPNVINDKYSVFINYIPWVYVCILNNIMLDPFSVHPYLWALSISFSLNRFISLDSPSKVSGSFLVAQLNILIPGPYM